MPRKAKTTAHKPAPAEKAKKNRRTPYELLQDLKQKRQSLAEKTERKLAQYDAKIESLESKYRQRIQIEEIKAQKSPDELEREIRELKEKQRLLRMAMKQSKA
jgi:TolA-binding protein